MFRFKSVLIVACCLLANGCFSLNDESFVNQIAGDYQGVIWNNGLYKGETRFYYEEDIQIKGRYIFQNKGGLAHGDLYNCQRKFSWSAWQFNLLQCRWREKHGQGNLIIEFNEDFSRFDGFWTAKNSEKQHIWNGEKVILN